MIYHKSKSLQNALFFAVSTFPNAAIIVKKIKKKKDEIYNELCRLSLHGPYGIDLLPPFTALISQNSVKEFQTMIEKRDNERPM